MILWTDTCISGSGLLMFGCTPHFARYKKRGFRFSLLFKFKRGGYSLLSLRGPLK